MHIAKKTIENEKRRIVEQEEGRKRTKNKAKNKRGGGEKGKAESSRKERKERREKRSWILTPLCNCFQRNKKKKAHYLNLSLIHI